MKGSSTRLASIVSGALVAALFLAGCASDPGWGVPPHPSARFTPVTTGDTDCTPTTRADKNVGCYSEAKQKAIERYQAAKKAGK